MIRGTLQNLSFENAARLAVYDHLLSFIAKITLSYFKGYFLCTEFCWLIKQSNPRNEISMISFVCFGTGGQVRTFEVFSPFFQSYAFGTYYEACKILIADVKCIMRTSFLQSFVSLGDQGDPTEPLIRKCCQAGCVWPLLIAQSWLFNQEIENKLLIHE